MVPTLVTRDFYDFILMNKSWRELMIDSVFLDRLFATVFWDHVALEIEFGVECLRVLSCSPSSRKLSKFFRLHHQMSPTYTVWRSMGSAPSNVEPTTTARSFLINGRKLSRLINRWQATGALMMIRRNFYCHFRRCQLVSIDN